MWRVKNYPSMGLSAKNFFFDFGIVTRSGEDKHSRTSHHSEWLIFFRELMPLWNDILSLTYFVDINYADM